MNYVTKYTRVKGIVEIRTVRRILRKPKGGAKKKKKKRISSLFVCFVTKND